MSRKRKRPEVTVHRLTGPVDRRWVASLARSVLSRHGRDSVQVNIVFADNEYIRRLNRRFRSRNAPTDVLSFNLDDDEGENLLGDVYISVEKAQSQASLYGCSLRDEIRRLTVHGLLHLLGYDHENAAEAKVMRKMEDQFLGAI